MASSGGHKDWGAPGARSEEHTSELQSHLNLVCRLLLEKKKTKNAHLRFVADEVDHPAHTATRHHVPAYSVLTSLVIVEECLPGHHRVVALSPSLRSKVN